MAFSSHLELVLTLLGWQLYELLWGIFVDTGLAFIPFLAIILGNTFSPLQSQDAKSASITSLSRMEQDIYKTIIILIIFIQPSFTISGANATQTSVCKIDENIAENASEKRLTDSIAGDITIGNGQAASIPPWFYLVLQISNGINSAFLAAMPCEISVRQIKSDANTDQIVDYHLRQEVDQFINQCYRRGRADLARNKTPIRSPYDDIGWIGAPFMVNGVYRQNYAEASVHGWPVDLNRESDLAHHSAEQEINPVWGYPRCDEWWNNSERGLRGRLLEEADGSWLSKLTALVGSREKSENAAIRTLLRNEKDIQSLDLTNAPDYTDENPSLFGMAIDSVWSAAEWAGGGLAALMVSFVTDMVVKFAPFIQALALFSIYMLLPLVFLVGNFSWPPIRTATVTIFAIKFWTPIWAIVSLLDNKLLTAMSTREGVHPIDYLSNVAGFNHIAVDLLIAGMYITLPGFVLMILSWAGESASKSISEMTTSMSGSAQSAGGRAGGVASSAAGPAAKAGKAALASRGAQK